MKERIVLIEELISNILRNNDLKVEAEPKKRSQKKERAVAKRPSKEPHDDVEEDKAMINKAVAKHTAKEHPGHAPTTIKKGGRPVPKPSAKKAGRGR
jgi:hypothetical protein